jgi:SAM-dependent methyltransferase
MHPEIDQFIDKIKKDFPQYFEGKKVLEVGSQNINGSVRKHFNNCDYLGIDLGDAPGVDKIENASEMTYFEEFDVVISSEMLEHCELWEKALVNMFLATKPGGIFILTCAGPNRQEHGTNNHTPQDSKFTLEHYRNISINDFNSALPAQLFKEYSLGLYRGETDLYFYGIKE